MILGLSRRQRQVLDLAACGRSIRQTAEILRIEPRTVEAHRAKAMQLLHASNITEAAVIYDRAQREAA